MLHQTLPIPLFCCKSLTFDEIWLDCRLLRRCLLYVKSCFYSNKILIQSIDLRFGVKFRTLHQFAVSHGDETYALVFQRPDFGRYNIDVTSLP